jgi:methionine sulfoxide reductase heme-binding subunit
MGDPRLGAQSRGRHARPPADSRPRTEARAQVAAPPRFDDRPRRGRAADAWMDHEVRLLGRPTSRRAIALWALRVPAFIPLFFMTPAILTANTNTMKIAVADVLGTGSEALLLLTLLVTPMITLTRQRWFVSLRHWYGVMFAIVAISDGIIASMTTGFAGGVVGRLAGHTFLLVGFTMVLLAIPLLAMANSPAQRWLGRYWKPLQRMTYAIWGLLFLHLALLFGFGVGTGESGDGDPIFHQRLFQLTACSIPLVTLRLPPVRRWVARQQKASRQWLVYLVFVPFGLLFVLGFAFIVNEEIFKGTAAFSLHPNAD